ncbi:MAG TPA: rod-binding protein [Steroidobacteraceae bacterium]|nr:rod-binding protein [Steroidobacteraceae bacterium]
MDPINASSALPSATPLTAAQTAALKKLHDAATQLEGVFVGMLFKEMNSTLSKDTIFGKQTNADDTWQDMLAEKQADAIAKTGSFGIAKMVESQLRAQVLANPGSAPAVPAAVVTPPVQPRALEDLP